MIKFDNVSSQYSGGIKCLSDVNFSIYEGAFIGLLGPSGAGKSTILWHIMGELTPYRGTVSCMGVNPSRLSHRGKRLYRRKIGFVPQELMLLQQRSVHDNVNIILRGINLSRKEAEIRTQNVLDIVGLRNRQTAKPHHLSGGEQQRLAIARALSTNPRILKADEPTGNLDPARSDELMTLFRQINDMGITVIVATHEWELIKKKGASLLYVDQGCVSEADAEAEVLYGDN